MARNAAIIRAELHVGFAVTESALREVSAEDAEKSTDAVDLPIFETVLDLRAESGVTTEGEGRIRRTPSVSTDSGIEMLVQELEELGDSSASRQVGEERPQQLRAAT